MTGKTISHYRIAEKLWSGLLIDAGKQRVYSGGRSVGTDVAKN
jgi:hypothetical protein